MVSFIDFAKTLLFVHMYVCVTRKKNSIIRGKGRRYIIETIATSGNLNPNPCNIDVYSKGKR